MCMSFSFSHFRQIFENAPLGIFLTSREGFFIDLNERLAQILGYDSVQEVKSCIKNLGVDLYVDPKDREKILGMVDSGGGIVVHDVCFKQKDGQVIYARLSISKFSESVRNSSLIGIVEDVSFKRELEIQLKERDNLLNSIVSSLPFELLVIDLGGYVVSQSGFSQKRWGSLLGANYRILPNQEFCGLEEFLRKAFNGEYVDLEKEFLLDGVASFHRVLVTPLYYGSQIKGAIVILVDQTEKVVAQRRTNEVQEFMATLINGVPVRLLWKDHNLRFLGANEAFLRDFGMNSQEELIGKTDYDLVDLHQADEIRSISVEVLKSGEPIVDRKLWISTVDNTKLFIILSFIPYFSKTDKKVLGVIACYQDITLMKRMEEELLGHQRNLERLVEERTLELHHLNEELLSSNKELLALNTALSAHRRGLIATLKDLKQTQVKLIQSEKMASLGVLTAGIAHELNNPLNFIKSGSQGLQLMAEEMRTSLEWCEKNEQNLILRSLVDDMQQLIASMNNGVERASETVKGLRVFSRVDTEDKCSADLHELIEAALTILKDRYRGRVEIVKRFKLNEPLNCFPGKLSQVLLNLLMNAFQSINGKGTVEIATLLLQDEGLVELVVKDSGCGIPVEIRNHVFDPFFTTKPVNEGVGMGLFIVHSLVSMMQGEISFSSEVGKGTIFRILLPVA